MDFPTALWRGNLIFFWHENWSSAAFDSKKCWRKIRLNMSVMAERAWIGIDCKKTVENLKAFNNKQELKYFALRRQKKSKSLNGENWKVHSNLADELFRASISSFYTFRFTEVMHIDYCTRWAAWNFHEFLGKCFSPLGWERETLCIYSWIIYFRKNINNQFAAGKLHRIVEFSCEMFTSSFAAAV